MKDLKITYFFHRPKEEIFDYFTRPQLFELWAAPDGMTLKVDHIENHEGGTYSMTHSSKEGDYKCTGYFKEYRPHDKLVQIDNILGPGGETFFHDLECITEFESERDGTKVTVTQRGFPDEKSLEQCKESWEQCFNKLESMLIEGEYGATLI